MNFSLTDVARLYGRRLFRLPAGESPAQPASQPEAVVSPPHPPSAHWVGPDHARLRLFIHRDEWENPATRSLLDKIIQSVGLTLADVAVFATEPLQSYPVVAQGTTLSFGLAVEGTLQLPSLAALEADVALKRQAWEQLKPLKGTL